MSKKQLAEKITHLNAQLARLNSLEFSIRNTVAISLFYTQRIAHYNRLNFSK